MQTYDASTWYKIKLVIDCDSDTYDIYIDDVLKKDDATFRNSVTSINKIAFRTSTTDTSDNYLDDVIIRKYTDPEPSTSIRSEEGFPIAPTIGTPTVLSSSSIRWNFTDNCDYETVFKLYDNNDSLVSTNTTVDLTHIDETGLSENTQYSGRYVKAYNSYGNSTSSSAASAIYTLADTPTNFSGTLKGSTVTLIVDSFPNDTSGSSGYYFYHSDGSPNSGWIQNSWQDTNLPCGNTTYYVKYRNGDGVETNITSYTATVHCGGGLPPAAYMPPTSPAPTPENPEGGFRVLINDEEYTESREVTLTLLAGNDTKRMAISSDPDFSPGANTGQISHQNSYTWDLCYRQKKCPSGVYIVYVKFYTQWGRASEVVSDTIILKSVEPEVSIEEMTIEEIKAKILEIQQKIIELLTQLIQLIQGRIAQLQAQLP